MLIFTKKYVKIIGGIYIIFLILNPIISNIDNINFENIFEITENTSSSAYLVAQKEMGSLYEKAIENEIEEKFKNIDVKIYFSEDLEEIDKIEIIVLEDIGNIEEIKNFLINNYGITAGRILCLTN